MALVEKSALGEGKTITSNETVSEQLISLVAVRVTVYLPSFEYVLFGGLKEVLLLPSPKSHLYFTVPVLMVVLFSNLNELPLKH